MSAGRIEANKVIFQKLFSQDFWFVIPEYQRSYVWQTDNIIELVEDLYYAFENKDDSDYFLGSLVLKKIEGSSFPEYEVLDGQQRLTTFFIMMAVMRDLISDDNSKNTIHKKIYQEENSLENIPARMRITYRIRDRVEDFINDFIISKGGTNRVDELKSLLESDNVSLSSMSNAILTLRDILMQKNESVDLLNYIKFIFNNALFIYVSTDNTEDAFRLVTILNDRGIPLTNSDILKSQNIGGLTSEKETQKYAKIWEEIEGKHGENFDRFLQFIRNIVVKEKARANLFDEFSEKIYTKDKLKLGKETFELIDKYNNIYEEIIELQDPSLSNEYKNLITVMRIGLRSEDWIPPLMFYSYKFGTEKIDIFLKKLEYKFSGDWICGVTPTLRLDAMNSMLKVIENTSKETLDSLLNNQDLYKIDIDEFKKNIEGNVYKKQYARYLLLKCEYLMSENTVHLSSYNYITVEHVLPQNPYDDSQWNKDFSEDDRLFWTNKLANLVLISKRKNSALSNKDFEEKKKVYLKKRIDVFNANKIFIEQNSKWNPVVLKERQDNLISLLSEI